MIVLNDLSDVEKINKDGIIRVQDDLAINFLFNSSETSIKCHNIYISENIILKELYTAGHIKAKNITANNIYTHNLECHTIKSQYIKASTIDCAILKGAIVDASQIEAGEIDVYDLTIWSYCIARKSFTVKTYKITRNNGALICLDSYIKTEQHGKHKIIWKKNIRKRNKHEN